MVLGEPSAAPLASPSVDIASSIAATVCCCTITPTPPTARSAKIETTAATRKIVGPCGCQRNRRIAPIRRKNEPRTFTTCAIAVGMRHSRAI